MPNKDGSRNPARDGMTVRELAELFTMYAKRNPDAIASFGSNESGGYWPVNRERMSVFVGEQCAIVDSTRVGGGVTFGVSLMTRKADDAKDASPADNVLALLRRAQRLAPEGGNVSRYIKTALVYAEDAARYEAEHG